MDTKLILFFILYLPFTGLAQNKATGIEGLWLNDEKTQIIEIYQKSNKYFGKIHWTKADSENPMYDINNDDPALRNRSIIGLDVLADFEYNPDRYKWKSGSIYNIDNGRTYNGKMRIDEEGNLKIHGYWWFFSFLGHTYTWTRVK